MFLAEYKFGLAEKHNHTQPDLSYIVIKSRFLYFFSLLWDSRGYQKRSGEE